MHDPSLGDNSQRVALLMKNTKRRMVIENSSCTEGGLPGAFRVGQENKANKEHNL